jgi:quercetin dioxygenase-like cupin family protein
MSDASQRHDQGHADLVSLHVLEALAPTDAARAEAQIAACADCRREVTALRQVVGAFVAWPTEVLRPSGSLWQRLASRIAAETGEPPVPPPPRRWADTAWDEVAPGISVKLLSTDRVHNRVSMLVRLAPGTDYPPHRHAGVEELYMLDGELIVDEQRFHPGDYRRAELGSVDHRVWTETGCACLLVTSFHDAIL